jgi:hypothetical protein
MAQKLAKEGTDLLSCDILIGMKAKKELDFIAFGSDPKGGDYGDFLMRTCALKQDRGLAAGTPGSAQDGRHQHAALVNEHNMSVQPAGFFLARGQSMRIQFKI